MNTRVLKGLAIAGLLVSILTVGWGIHAMLAAGRMLGPSALLVAPNGTVWIGVDQQLWRATPDGRLIDTADLAALGLPGAPANLLRHPDGAVVATVRDDATLYFLDPVTAKVIRTQRPAWPQDLADHGGRAINLAFHPDGRIAIATGGGHAVALFDGQGRFLARTAPGTYEFTNGLWWVGEALWTTDTNRLQLKRLDGRSLQTRESVALASPGREIYLGPARVHPQAGGGQAPMAALMRFANGMIRGHVVAVSTDGVKTEFRHSAPTEPGDMDWQDGRLLMTDRLSMSILRWTPQGQALAPFGDSGLQERLRRHREAREALKSRYALALRVGIPVFLLAFALAAWAQWQEQGTKHKGGSALDLSALGTPFIDTGALVKLGLKAYGPVLALFPIMLGLMSKPVALGAREHFGQGGALVLFTAVMILVALMVPWLVRRSHRLAQRQEYEPLFNRQAMLRLRSADAVSLGLEEGERVLEAIILRGWDFRWVLLTDRRLLMYPLTLSRPRLKSAYRIAEIAGASTEAGAFRKPGAAAWLQRMFNSNIGALAPGLSVALLDGKLISGAVMAPTVAARMAERLNRQAARPASPPGAATTPVASLARAHRLRRVWETLASALVPGLGQWAQRRRSTALALFVPWLSLVLFVTVPLVWVLAGPRAAVAPDEPLLIGLLHLLLSGLAALDAWRTSGDEMP